MKEKKRLKVVDVTKASSMLDETKKQIIYSSIFAGVFAIGICAGYKYGFNKDTIHAYNLGFAFNGTITLLELGGYIAYKDVIKNFDISQIEQEQKEEEKGRTL